jgi:ASC-1-like (ASCH) protein
MSYMSLRIKKVYFDKIKSGEKTVEYRKNSKFYRRLFAKKITSLTFHYQKPPQLTVKILDIRLIKKPAKFANDETLPTKKIYAIYLER